MTLSWSAVSISANSPWLDGREEMWTIDWQDIPTLTRRQTSPSVDSWPHTCFGFDQFFRYFADTILSGLVFTYHNGSYLQTLSQYSVSGYMYYASATEWRDTRDDSHTKRIIRQLDGTWLAEVLIGDSWTPFFTGTNAAVPWMSKFIHTPGSEAYAPGFVEFRDKQLLVTASSSARHPIKTVRVFAATTDGLKLQNETSTYYFDRIPQKINGKWAWAFAGVTDSAYYDSHSKWSNGFYSGQDGPDILSPVYGSWNGSSYDYIDTGRVYWDGSRWVQSLSVGDKYGYGDTESPASASWADYDTVSNGMDGYWEDGTRRGRGSDSTNIPYRSKHLLYLNDSDQLRSVLLPHIGAFGSGINDETAGPHPKGSVDPFIVPLPDLSGHGLLFYYTTEVPVLVRLTQDAKDDVNTNPDELNAGSGYVRCSNGNAYYGFATMINAGQYRGLVRVAYDWDIHNHGYDVEVEVSWESGDPETETDTHVLDYQGTGEDQDGNTVYIYQKYISGSKPSVYGSRRPIEITDITSFQRNYFYSDEMLLISPEANCAPPPWACPIVATTQAYPNGGAVHGAYVPEP